MRFVKPLTIALMLTATPLAFAVTPADKYPESQLYSKPVKVAENIYSAIGQLKFYTYENAGHNNNLSYVIGEDAVLVVNGSSSYQLSKALHDEIKQVTSLPVKWVVDENGQSHASLGNSYWKEQGATIIAHKDAAKEVETHGFSGLNSLKEILKERAEGTKIIPFDEVFEDEMELDLGGLTAKLVHLGPAHSAGDISVIIPERNVIIAGDIAFHQRMLPIVPGHGDPTNFVEVDKYTRGYLEYLRGKVQEILDEGGSLSDAYEIDQTPYMHLETADELAGKNAGRIFEAMEWE
ncbi:MAG: hypothetical protein RL143_1421 [Pseudomonadota bacterium]